MVDPLDAVTSCAATVNLILVEMSHAAREIVWALTEIGDKSVS